MKFIRVALLLLSPVAFALGTPCIENMPLTGSIGIGLLRCLGGRCAVNGQTPNGLTHFFSVEPRVSMIDADGPARELREGDAIVSIDDVLITTREGGWRLANLIANVPIALRVRRNGRELVFRIVPRLGCNTPRIVVSPDPDEPGPGPQDPPPIPPFDLGVRVKCGQCGWVRRDSGVVWRSGETPRVISVEKGGAGEIAGLQIGDELFAIDGMSMTNANNGAAIAAIKPGRRVRLTISRDGRMMDVNAVVRAYPGDVLR